MSEASTRVRKTLHLGILHGFSTEDESPKKRMQGEGKTVFYISKDAVVWQKPKPPT